MELKERHDGHGDNNEIQNPLNGIERDLVVLDVDFDYWNPLNGIEREPSQATNTFPRSANPLNGIERNT
jgi:hypothetical protein